MHRSTSIPDVPMVKAPSCNFHLFQKRWDTETWQARSFFLPPTDSSCLPQPHLQDNLVAFADSWTIPGPSYCLRNKPQAKPFWGSVLTFPLGEMCVLWVLFLLVSVFKDGWRGTEPMLLHWGSLFLINEFSCLVTKPLTVNLAKRFPPQFELEPWPVIILIFLKAEQNLQYYFNRRIVF